MSDTHDTDALIERLAELAANRRVPRGPDPEALLREAGIVGRARARTAQRRRLAVMGGVGSLALALTLALAWPRPPEGASIERLALGPHAIATTSGTALAIDTLGERTAIRVDGGSALFDVARLPAGSHFEVITPDASVRVVGTVFAVAFVNQHTEVEVFEGVVEVERGGRTTRLVAGEHLDSRSDDALAALRDRGRAAASRRESHARVDPGAAVLDAIEPEPVEDDATEAVADGIHETRAPSDDESGEREHVALPTSPETHIDLTTLRALCDRGEFAAALAALEGVRPPRAERGEWALLEGDAARATGDLARAAGAYERAADALTPSRAALAGFLAASTHERLGDLDAALSVLDRAHAADRGSPLEERALAMRANLLARTGHTRQAHEAARRYLASFPGGEASARMDALLE
jgi:hypothetical protein